jgi:Fe-Mn family superoxide dismutase
MDGIEPVAAKPRGAASLFPITLTPPSFLIPHSSFLFFDMPHSLPALPYAFDALEPHIDTMTMQIHHGKHHQTYVNNLNAALDKHSELHAKSLDDLLGGIANVPDDIRTAVRNNGGGHWNHTLFWQLMGPGGGGEPEGALGASLKSAFGDFSKFKEQFAAAGVGRFGSGWAWLVRDGGKLSIMSTPNQDNPLMDGRKAADVILGLDVWEHAYYLKYQNRRPDYIAAWWNVVNWREVERRYGG